MVAGALYRVGMRHETAYRVPLTVDRGPGHLYRFTNVGGETLHGVALTLHGSGIMGANPPARLDPGQSLEVDIIGRALARDSILVIRWFRPNGIEYLWRVSF